MLPVKLIKNELFSITTICFIAIPLILNYTGDKDKISKASTKLSIPSISKMIPNNEITRTIKESVIMVKNIKLK